jgi:hypothetical protein
VTAAWRRFRGLRVEAQAAVWLGVIGVYTVGLVLILGGGGGDDGEKPANARADWSPTERMVARAIEGAPVKKAEVGDVPAFRRPSVSRVECDDGACAVVYSIGLTGNGRIREDQQPMLQRIFREPSIKKVEMRVFRGSTVGPNQPAKPAEETPPGSFILATSCVRSTQSVSLPDEQLKLPPIPASCSTSLSQSQGPANRASGRAKSAGPEQSEAGGSGDGGLLEEQR